MKFLMNVAQTVAGDVSVNFRGSDRSMTQEFLDDAKVSAVFEEVSREAVTQHVRSDISTNAGTPDALLDPKPEGHGGEGCAAFCEKDVGRRASGHEFGPSDRDVAFESDDSFFAQRQDALFVAFADDVYESSFEMDLLETNATQFGEAKTGSVGEFENCLVTKRLGSFRCFGREKFFDFLAGKRLGQTLPSARKGQILGDIGWEEFFDFREAIECAESSDLEIDTFATEPAGRFFRLIRQGARPLVLEEGNEVL